MGPSGSEIPFYCASGTFARVVIPDVLYKPAPIGEDYALFWGKWSFAPGWVWFSGHLKTPPFTLEAVKVALSPLSPRSVHWGRGVHEGFIVGLSLCQTALSIICGCLQGPRRSQIAPPGLASTEWLFLPCKARWTQEVSGHIAAKQPQLRGKAANPVHVPVCKLDHC